MKKLSFCLIILSIFFSGCKQLIYWKYGIKNPKPETPESILGFIKKWKQDSQETYIFKDSSAFFRYMNDPVYKKNLLGSMFYNEKGLLINFKDSTKCQWSAGYFVSRLRADTLYQTDTTYKYQEILADLIPVRAPDSPVRHDSSYDYTVIITWAKYLGKYNERLFVASESVNENNKAKIRLILLNIDMQKSWNLRKDQRIRIN